MLAAALGREIDTIERQPGRTRSKVFRASTPDGELALKVYPVEHPIAEVRSEVRLALALRKAGVAVPRYLQTAGSEPFVELSDGSHAVVYEWVKGEVPGRFDRALVVKGAQLMADFHAAARDLPLIRDDTWLWEDAARHTAGRADLPGEYDAWIRDRVAGGRPWNDTAALVACHNDLFPANMVLTPAGDLFAIDLTNVILGPQAWDLAVYCAGLLLTAQALCLGPEAVCDLAIQGYANHGAERKVERDDTFDLLEFALAQRSVFLTEGATPRAARRIWRRLDIALRSLSPHAKGPGRA